MHTASRCVPPGPSGSPLLTTSRGGRGAHGRPVVVGAGCHHYHWQHSYYYFLDFCWCCCQHPVGQGIEGPEFPRPGLVSSRQREAGACLMRWCRGRGMLSRRPHDELQGMCALDCGREQGWAACTHRRRGRAQPDRRQQQKQRSMRRVGKMLCKSRCKHKTQRRMHQAKYTTQAYQ